jgi:sporulation-control protein spo0M
MDSNEVLRLILVLLGVFGSFRLGIAYERYEQKCRARKAREWFESMLDSGEMKIEKIVEHKEKEDGEKEEE